MARPFSGGDFHTVVLVDEFGTTRTYPELYSLPTIEDADVRARLDHRLDASDGELDDKWDGARLERIQARNGNPAAAGYEQWLLERLIATEDLGDDDVPDLLFVNFKAADEAGHLWGMRSDRVGRVLAALDRGLRDLVRALSRNVGARRWVLLLTADHGQMPLPEDSGGWAIHGAELAADANSRFDRNYSGIDLVGTPGQASRPRTVTQTHRPASRASARAGRLPPVGVPYCPLDGPSGRKDPATLSIKPSPR